ncbi:hypothetical protein [Mesobacterium pallidum]|uniref:hypothetical protein n=1 Tax=Mesobacterium pallidum TaxID=2872037 RepID=UPI001EE33C20|nr:hypothetical protein [Mesobacterium pallidum]
MQGCIVQVWFEVDFEARRQRPPFQFIETEFPDFATFGEFVEQNRLISGAILITSKPVHIGAPNIVIRRDPILFRGEAVMRAQLPTWRFAEADA